MVVRAATEADLQPIRTIAQGYGNLVRWPQRPDYIDHELATGRLAVCEAQGEVVGFGASVAAGPDAGPPVNSHQKRAPPAGAPLRSPTGGGWPGRPYMLGQLWVVDDPEPEPVDGFDVAAGAGEAAVLAASAGAARASATPPTAPMAGTAARSQSFLGSRIDVTSFVELTRLQRLWKPS